MKFSLKLVLSTTAIIAVLFSIGGTVMIGRNFQCSIKQAEEENLNQHALERYAVESNMVRAMQNGETVNRQKLREFGKSITGYVSGQSRQLALYTAEKVDAYSSLPANLAEEDVLETLNQNGVSYLVKQAGNRSYMLTASQLTVQGTGVYVISAKDITSVFEERQRQLEEFLLLDGIIVLVSVAMLFLLASFLTRPIKKLTLASRCISEGAYQERIHLNTGGEIGELGKNFNLMAESIEGKIGELESMVSQRDDFIGSFSHEIKTPMTAIIGYADMLRSMECSREMTRKSADYIYREGKRLESLSHKMMDFMQLSGELIKLEKLDAEALLQRAARSAQPLLGGIPLTVDAQPCTILGESELLCCLIVNLLDNAAKAGEQGNRVSLTGARQGALYRVQVEDAGRGIAPQELKRITEPFYMVDKSRSRAVGGAGLGLSTGQKIAQAHGDMLHFESEPGVGTRVWLLLRAEEGSPGEK